MNGTVVVFARRPELGRVKTRLAAVLDAEDVLLLYRAFLRDTLESARRSGARVALAHTPGPADFPEARLADVRLEQRGATFGERFDDALAQARAAAEGPVVLVGADTPHLPPDALRGALDALDESEAVIGPSSEGGFHLVGFRRKILPLREAFDGPNEAARVARTIRGEGLVTTLLPTLFDVDVPADLADLVLHIELRAAVARAWVPSATRDAIATLGLEAAQVGASGTRGFALERHRRVDSGGVVGVVGSWANARAPASNETLGR